MKIEFEGTVDELRELMSGDNVGTDSAVIQLEKDKNIPSIFQIINHIIMNL